MTAQNKRSNKELVYVLIFLVAAITWFYFNPVDIIRDFIDLSPNELAIKQKIFTLGLFPIFYNVVNIMIFGSMFFLLCSVYAGIHSLKKASRL